jgi:hypothetical protein
MQMGVVVVVAFCSAAAAAIRVGAQDAGPAPARPPIAPATGPAAHPELAAFKVYEEDGTLTLRYSYKRRMTRVILGSDQQDEYRLTIPVSHFHGFGTCRGMLVITPRRVRYEPESGDHGFALAHDALALKPNFAYFLGSTIEVTPHGAHRRRFKVACLIRETFDTTGYVKTCDSSQDPVVSLAASALRDFASLRASVVAAVDRP